MSYLQQVMRFEPKFFIFEVSQNHHFCLRYMAETVLVRRNFKQKNQTYSSLYIKKIVILLCIFGFSSCHTLSVVFILF